MQLSDQLAKRKYCQLAVVCMVLCCCVSGLIFSCRKYHVKFCMCWHVGSVCTSLICRMFMIICCMVALADSCFVSVSSTVVCCRIRNTLWICATGTASGGDLH